MICDMAIGISLVFVHELHTYRLRNCVTAFAWRRSAICEDSLSSYWAPPESPPPAYEEDHDILVGEEGDAAT